MKKRFGLVLCLALTWLTAMVTCAASMPDLEERTDTLTIQCSAKNNLNEDVMLSGVELSLAKVADVTCINGNVTYSLNADYAPAQISFAGMTASQSIDAAQTLSTIQVQDKLAVNKLVTDENGTVAFTGLTHGMYLVRQTGKSKLANKYTTYAPFLVMVPSVEKNVWNYDVAAYPKTTVKPKKEPVRETEPPTEPPKNPPTNPPTNTTPPTPGVPNKNIKTGDNTPLAMWGIVMVISMLVLMALLSFKRKKEIDS